MQLNQYKENKNDSINTNNGDNSKNKNDDGNTIIIIIVIIINSLFQPDDFSAESTAALHVRRSPQRKIFVFFLQDTIKTAFKMRI